MKALTLCLVTAALAGPSHGGYGYSWQSFTHKSAGYAAEFPGKPQPYTRQLTRGAWKSTLRAHGMQVSEGALMVLYVDSPMFLSAIKGREHEVLEDAIQQVKEKPGVKVEQEGKIAFQGLPGYMLVLKAANGMSMVDYIVLRGKRVYQITWMGPKDSMNAPVVKRFFKGFKLI